MLQKHASLIHIVESSESLTQGPLLKVYIPREKLYCTLSFTSGVPIAECNLIRDLFTTQPLCKYLVQI